MTTASTLRVCQTMQGCSACGASVAIWKIVYQDGWVTIQPLQREVEDDALTDFSQLHDPEVGVVVMERNSHPSCIS